MSTKRKGMSIAFAGAAAYDGLIGLIFLCWPLAMYRWFEITPPNHVGYVQFPAAILLVFAVMFLAIARRPVANRSLIPYGIGLKLCYCLVAGWHWFAEDIPGMWKPFVIADAAFAVFFLWAYVSLGRTIRR